MRLLTIEFGARAGRLQRVSGSRACEWPALLRSCRQLDAGVAPFVLRALRLDDRWSTVGVGTQTVSRLYAAATALTDGQATPQMALSATYQHLARYRPEQFPTGTKLIVASGTRKHRGQFYTPYPVAEFVVEAAFAALPRGAEMRPRILDPAMGTGVFLLAAFRHIVAHDPTLAPVQVAEACLFGIDSDPSARELAILTLWLETGARPEIVAENLLEGDFLRDDHAERDFDLILGNPPWGVVPVEQLARSDDTVRGAEIHNVDSFKLFLERGAQRTVGALAMIVPQALLMQTTHAGTRDRVLHALAPYWVSNLGDRVFAGIAVPACAVVFGPRPGPDRIHICHWRRSGEGRGEARYHIPAASWSAAGFPLAPDRLRDLLTRLRSVHPTLGELSDRYVVRDAGLNYNRASVARRSLYRAEHPDHSWDLPCYRGRDFSRYGEIRRSGWLRHDAWERLEPGEELSYSRSLMALPEKIVLRQTADCLVATLDCTTMVMGRSVLAITAAPGASLRALLACLNSRLLTVLYRVLAGEEGRIMPQVKVARLRALPLPNLVCAGDDSRSLWYGLDALGVTLCEARGAAPAALRTVDELVCGFYGLTPAEIDLLAA